MKKLNNEGLAPVIIVVLTLVVVGICFAGYRVYENSKDKKSTQQNQSTQTQADTIGSEAPETSDYKNTELSVSLKYPSEWGVATLVTGPLSKYQSGEYKQLNFSKASNVSINFVTGPYSSPLDACGYDDPVQNAQHFQNSKQASVIGWEGNDIKEYMTGQGFDGPTIIRVNAEKRWTEISKDNKVLIYKDLDKPENRIKASAADGVCGAITQAQADEANAFINFFHYAVNYSNNKVKGVNAQFDARKGDDEGVRNQLTEVLNGIQ